MSTEVIVALIAAFSGLAVSIAGLPINYTIARRTRQLQKYDVMSKYRDPLLWAAFDLNSRIYNLVRQDFIRYWDAGSPPERNDTERRSYIVNSTLFVIAEYLAWAELIRRHVRFLDLGAKPRSRQLMSLLFQIQRTLSTNRLDQLFCIFRSEQRAIGELMIADTSDQSARSCIGYATFCTRLATDPDFSRWFSNLTKDVERLATRPTAKTDRLVTLQNKLMDLIDFLDPDALRFPSAYRDRLG